nr:shikimate dehydrogenase [Armatimonadota bacterium]
MIHPLDARRDASRKWPWVRHLPEQVVEWGLLHKRSFIVSHITGIRSPTGAEAEGWFICCPLTPQQFFSVPLESVYDRMVECGEIAQDLGALILGLGAFTSVVGDGGITVANRLKIPVTTGNSYTVAVAIQETLAMARRMQISLPADIAIVGATGSIGSTSAEILAPYASCLTLVGRNTANLDALAEKIRPECPGTVRV